MTTKAPVRATRALPRIAYYDTIPYSSRQYRANNSSSCLLAAYKVRSKPCYLSPLSRRTFHTTPIPHGGQAASFPKLLRSTHLSKRLSKERQLNEFFGDMASATVQMEESQRQGKLPDDIGLLKGTLVWPTGESANNVLNDYPWFGKGMTTRAWLEVRRRWKRVKDYFSVLIAEKPSGWSLPRPKLRMTKMIAKDLHRDMNAAFARGQPEDLAKLHDITCNNLREILHNRIISRPKGVTYEWVLHHISEAKVVSHRAAILPLSELDDEKTTIRQAVVRIRSIQSLTRHVDPTSSVAQEEIDANGNKSAEHVAAEQEAMKKSVVEYLVIQKRVMRGVQEGWKVWGTTEETMSLSDALNEAPATESTIKQIKNAQEDARK